MQGKYVLIGNSAAALAAIDWIRKFDRHGRIAVINRETGPAYSRVALPYFVAGQKTEADLMIRTPADYAGKGVDLIDGRAVTAIDPRDRRVTLDDGATVAYERLLLGTGSECVRPPISGLETVGAHYLWTLDDARRMKAAAEKARSAVIIGGGFIGMLAAEALRKLRLRLTVVEMTDQLLPQLLDVEGGRRVLGAVGDAGVSVRLSARVEAVRPAGGGVEVSLHGGETLSADMVVVAAGVRPNLSCLGGGVCATRTGILVDEFFETSAPGVYAAGDVAEARDFLADDRSIHAIWPTAIEQGRLAGANMAGKKIPYQGSLGMNVVELFALTLAQLGRFREGPGDDVQLLGGAGAGMYRKVVVDKDGVLAGGLYVGDENGVAEMGVIHGLIRRRGNWRDFAAHRLPRFTYATTVQAVPRGVTT